MTKSALAAKAEPKTREQKLEEELAQWRKWGVIEIMIRNPNVDSFVKETEAEIIRLRALAEERDELVKLLSEARVLLSDPRGDALWWMSANGFENKCLAALKSQPQEASGV